MDINDTTNSPHQHLFGTPTTLPLARPAEVPLEFPDSLLIFSGFLTLFCSLFFFDSRVPKGKIDVEKTNSGSGRILFDFKLDLRLGRVVPISTDTIGFNIG